MPPAPQAAAKPPTAPTQAAAGAPGALGWRWLLIVLWGANFSGAEGDLHTPCRRAASCSSRYLIMPVAAALLLCSRFGLRWPRVSRADAFALLRLGLVGHLLHVGLVTYGIHWSTAFSSSLILACGPVFTL